MGVFNTSKKLPRKVKKTIRRTLSALCMVSAIIVALVPPEVTKAYVAPSIANSYEYGVEATDTTDLKLLDANLVNDSVDLSKFGKPGYTESDPTIYKTMTVKKLTTGAYEIGWQFELYTLPNGKGVICKYNSMYATGTLRIAAMLPLSYNVVEESFYSDFFEAHKQAKKDGTVNATIQNSPDAPATTTVKSRFTIAELSQSYIPESDQDMIERYYPEIFAAHTAKYNNWVSEKQAYEAYLVTYANWLAAGDGTPAPTVVPDPGACPSTTVWVDEMELTQKYKYFCAAQPYYQGVLGGLTTARTFELEKVVDSRNGSQTPAKYCYMPKGTPNYAVNSIDVNDEYGFLGSNWTTVLGIGDNAFANTTNVTSLELCDEMKYIGDFAFYNSFVESISFDNVQDIGNRAFKDCTRLKNISLSNTTVNIGTEAFYGCNALASLTLPQSISYVGPGAFAADTALVNLDLSNINQSNCNIDDFAFYDCLALTSVDFSDKIARFGEACFACGQGVKGNLIRFDFPDHINGFYTNHKNVEQPGIGNFVLAGRTNLQYVTMPADYGRSKAVELPFGVFYNCINLKSVTFPADGGGSCGYVTFGSSGEGDAKRTIFDTIQSREFCVYGPEVNGAGKIASPRESTWGLKTAIGNDVPYIYKNASGEQVEISNNQYILIIDENGVLKSCNFASNEKKAEALVSGLDLEIPEYVGDTKVTGVATDCFANQDIHDNIKTIKIADNTISEIAPSAFKDCTRLESVSIGNSVTKIGDSAFAGCPKLTYVSFNTPKGGYSSFPIENIGANAFSTGAPSLIFEGDIDEQYGPFAWATRADNYVDEASGVRVCYKTGYPYYLTVIVDNRNGLPTLVDYPHYDQLNDYDDALMDSLKLPHSEAGKTLIDRYERLGEEEVDPSTGSVVYTYSISLAEEKLVNAVLNLDIPAGIKSIDVNGYMNNKSKLGDGYSSVASNSNNVSLYLLSSPYYQTYKSVSPYTGGLFKGYYGKVDGTEGKREYPMAGSNAKYEIEDIGNDRIKSVVMHTVEYLPDYAFYSCENLSNINLGNNLKEMGDAPFTGCTSLTSIGSSTNDFICYNGIVYSENPDGTYNIVEVLSARGKSVGSQKIKASEEDPYLSNVSTISDGAFENCDYITGVDFNGMPMVKELSDACFKDCDKLNQVVLPDTIKSIGHNAFAGCMEGIEIVCYGREVYLPADAFGSKTYADNNKFVESKRVVSYRDSAVRKAAADLGADVTEVLDDTVKVQFFDYDGTELSKIIYVNVGSSIALEDIPANPVRTGYTFAGWNKDLKNIKTDSVIVATYTQDPEKKPDEGNTPGGDSGNGGTNTNPPGGNNTTPATKFYTLTVTNGNGSGSYAEGATVIITCTEPPKGKVFDKWVAGSDDLGIASVNVAATTLKMPAHEATVEATFKNAPTGGDSGNGGNNNTPGGNNNNNPTKPNGSTIVISKPGLSNGSLASATVSGSSDNYVIRIAETAAATAAVEKALTNEYGSLDNIRYSAMDITLYDATGTNRITDYSGLSITITLPLPDVMAKYAGNNKVAGVVNEKLDKLKPKFTSIDGVPCVTFTATHFSPYTIYVDTTNTPVAGIGTDTGKIDGSPQTGDGIAPKWFLSFGLAALSVALFFMKDKKPVAVKKVIA